MIFPGLKRFFALLTVLYFSVFNAGADPVRGEFWIRDDQMEILPPEENQKSSEESSGRKERVLKELLEDARWAFSGMIYGFSVSWTPPSGSRNVKEELTISPLAQIPYGDPRMRVVSITRENGFDYVLFEYNPDASQESRLEGWCSEAFPASAGTAVIPGGEGSRREAMEGAVKQALKAYLRVRDYNRPREIRGRVAFTEFPQTGFAGGSVSATVRLRMDIEALRPYRVD
jgi:hypothetical protein